MHIPEPVEGRTGELVDFPVALDAECDFGQGDRAAQQPRRVDLRSAHIIVSGGYGMGTKENFELHARAGAVLGGAVGASRAAVDAGFIHTITRWARPAPPCGPKLYIACGISGAVQHRAGMEESGEDHRDQQRPRGAHLRRGALRHRRRRARGHSAGSSRRSRASCREADVDNFFTDNPDIQWHFDHLDLEDVVASLRARLHPGGAVRRRAALLRRRAGRLPHGAGDDGSDLRARDRAARGRSGSRRRALRERRGDLRQGHRHAPWKSSRRPASWA